MKLTDPISKAAANGVGGEFKSTEKHELLRRKEIRRIMLSNIRRRTLVFPFVF